MNNALTTETIKKSLAKMDSQGQAMFRQLKLMISNGSRLTNEEALALATFGRVEGLDPLNGECWILKGKNDVVVGCAVGIKGLRKKASEGLPEGEFWFPHFDDISSEMAGKDKDIKIAYKCTIRYTAATQRYIDLRKQVVDSGLSVDEAKEICGPQPEWEGIGIFRFTEENQYRDAKYPQDNRAKKRAEAEAIKAWRGFGYTISHENGNGLMPSDGQLADEGEEIVEIDEETGEILDGNFTDKSTAELAIDTIRILTTKAREDKRKPLTQGHRGMLIGALTEITSPGDTDMKRHKLTKAVFGKTSSKDLTPSEWIGLWDYVKPEYTKDSSGLVWNKAAEKSINQIIAESNAQEGQEELFGGEIAG